MRAPTAAAYCDELSVEAFKRRIGSTYPAPLNINGRRQVWLREQLDEAIDHLSGKTQAATSLAHDIGDPEDLV